VIDVQRTGVYEVLIEDAGGHKGLLHTAAHERGHRRDVRPHARCYICIETFQLLLRPEVTEPKEHLCASAMTSIVVRLEAFSG